MRAAWQKQLEATEQRAIKAVYALLLDFSATYVIALAMFFLALGIELSPHDPVVMWLGANTPLPAFAWKWLLFTSAVAIVTFRLRVSFWGVVFCVPFFLVYWDITAYASASGYGVFTLIQRIINLVGFIYLLARGGAFDMLREAYAKLLLKERAKESDTSHAAQ